MIGIVDAVNRSGASRCWVGGEVPDYLSQGIFRGDHRVRGRSYNYHHDLNPSHAERNIYGSSTTLHEGPR